MTTKKIYVLGGGTVYHVRPHMALSAPAYGSVARKIYRELTRDTGAVFGNNQFQVILGLTRMANPGPSDLNLGETNKDVASVLERIVSDPDTSMIFMSTALCDYDGYILDDNGMATLSGKGEKRLKTSEGPVKMILYGADKLIGQIRKHRKDIFLVGFKTTAGADHEAQFEAGLGLLKKNSCNLVLANDIQTGQNMIVVPELAHYSVTRDRNQVVHELVNMAMSRHTNTFSRTEIREGSLWPMHMAPRALETVVKACVKAGAYKPFNDITVGHFGFKWTPGVLVSSRRKQNFNRPECLDLVKVYFEEESGKQVAYGGKPSAGARSQYEVLSRFEENMDCIIHFHCPAKSHSMIPVRPQRDFECGSHECGKNTADGMVRVNKDLAAVMLDKHGPNIVFSSKADPNMVIDFIMTNFDLGKQTR